MERPGKTTWSRPIVCAFKAYTVVSCIPKAVEAKGSIRTWSQTSNRNLRWKPVARLGPWRGFLGCLCPTLEDKCTALLYLFWAGEEADVQGLPKRMLLTKPLTLPVLNKLKHFRLPASMLHFPVETKQWGLPGPLSWARSDSKGLKGTAPLQPEQQGQGLPSLNWIKRLQQSNSG